MSENEEVKEEKLDVVVIDKEGNRQLHHDIESLGIVVNRGLKRWKVSLAEDERVVADGGGLRIGSPTRSLLYIRPVDHGTIDIG